jgi:hypothetical protein
MQNPMFKNGMDAGFEPRNAIVVEILFAAGKKIGTDSAVPTVHGWHAPKNSEIWN